VDVDDISPAGRDTPLWIYKCWDSLDLSGMAMKILLRDVLGYRNISFYYSDYTTGKEPLRAMGGPKIKEPCTAPHKCFMPIEGGEEIGPDLFMEYWSLGWEAIYQEMVVDSGNVIDLGPTGVEHSIPSRPKSPLPFLLLSPHPLS